MAVRNSKVASRGPTASEAELSRLRQAVNEELVLSSLRAFEAVDAAEERAADLLVMGELREELLGILGHDLRRPLGAMMMGINVLVARGNLTDADARVASRILVSGDRMNRMISQILEFTCARLGGGLMLELGPADLGDVCRAVAEELELAASVSVECTVDGDLTGTWDADRLTEVLSNIGGNAIEHARPGTRIALHAYCAGTDVVVDICNEGQPIPPDLLPHIFEPFRRAKPGASSKAGNLGLGLYIASEVVLAHGGELVARSSGGTTTFTMRLPRDATAPSLPIE
jgi:signal transduction histidine kinase